MNKKIKALLMRLAGNEKSRTGVEKTSKYLLILSAVMALISNLEYLPVAYFAAIVATIASAMVKVIYAKNLVEENDVKWRYIMLGEYEFSEIFIWIVYIFITGIITVIFKNTIVFILLQLVGIMIIPAVTNKLTEWAKLKQKDASEEAEFDSEWVKDLEAMPQGLYFSLINLLIESYKKGL